MILKKIVFPFFNTERHHFLLEKWWFRLLIVLYIIGILVLLRSVLLEWSFSYYGWCYDTLDAYLENAVEYSRHLNECRGYTQEGLLPVISMGLLQTAAIHYFVQFIFFKIVVNFIALGGREKLKA